MPANLPPEFFSAEKKFRDAKTPEEKIASLEELISTIPKHKGTDKLRAEYRRKLSKLKSSAQALKKKGKHENQFYIEKEGAGRVIIVGCANVGKSSLVAALTHATPEVSECPYTTWITTPGMMTYDNVQIQLIDTPPFYKDYVEPELMNLLRSSDLVLLMVDLQAFPIEQFLDTLEILNQNHIVPLHKKDENADRRISYIPMIIVINKDDDEKSDDDFRVFNELVEDEWVLIPISIKTSRNLELLMKTMIGQMKIMKIFSKPPGKEAETTRPFVLKEGSTVEDFAVKVHKEFFEKLKSARIWGAGVFDGQTVGRNHILHDGDIVELHI